MCQVNKLGWQVVDPGPPLWIRSPDNGVLVDIAISPPVQLSGSDKVRWAENQLSGPQGAFGPLLNCELSPGFLAQPVSAQGCDAPGPEDQRQGIVYAVQTPAGLQLIGALMPAGMRASQINYDPLWWLSSEGRGVNQALVARAAIAIFAGARYYVKAGGGAANPPIEAVYHYWSFRAQANGGARADKGTDFLLFKNGEVWRAPNAGPGDIVGSLFREARWRDCGTWRSQAGGLLLKMNNGQPTLVSGKNLQRYAPSAKEHVEGRWALVISNFTGTDSYVQTSRSLRLHGDGRFELESYTAVGPHPSGMRTSPPVQFRGRYRIEGYTLAMDYDDDTKARDLFYWAGDGRDGLYKMFLWNGASWLGGLAQ